MDEIKSALQKLLDKQEQLHEHTMSIDKSLLRNTITLEEHVKRTNLLEQQVSSFQGEIKPIQEHVQNVQGVGKFMKYFSWILGIIIALSTIYKLFSS